MMSIELRIFFCNIKLQNCLLSFETKLFSSLHIVYNTFEIIFQKYEDFYHCYLKFMLNKLNSYYNLVRKPLVLEE